MGWRNGIWRPLLLPGGAIFLLALGLIGTGILHVSPSAATGCWFAILAAGLLLAGRFHSSRLLFVLLTIFLSSRAMEFFAAATPAYSGPGRIAFEAVAFLVPLNFLLVHQSRERGLVFPSIVRGTAILFLEAVFVAVICRPGAVHAPGFLHASFFGDVASPRAGIPQPSLLLFGLAFAALLAALFLHRKSLDGGLLWSLTAVLLGLDAGGTGKQAQLYFATAGLILAASLVETSYFLAYHDELTSLPARRAFSEALAGLPETYAIAAVDIDHFKSFNDTYGHETGDEVLRMVAGKLAQVGGGGHAYRTGGEEFTVLFPGRTAKEALPHLESLRQGIESSRFKVRTTMERRGTLRGPDRRMATKRNVKAVALPAPTRHHADLRASNPRSVQGQALSVTVSIGVAGPDRRLSDSSRVLQAADRALYRAKQAGRNRVEAANPPLSPRQRKRGIA